MDTQDTEAQALAQEHDAQEKALEVTTLEGASDKLSAILRQHKEGQPIIAEMAARIAERENILL
jgi:hypothetical protein